jgi:two-component system, LytTR family, response regulator
MTGLAMRTLLVDDEQPARERLRQLLAAHADVQVVGEAEDGVQAAERIAELAPDVVFLDIQMPGCLGARRRRLAGPAAPGHHLLHRVRRVRRRRVRAVGHRLPAEARQPGAAGDGARPRAAGSPRGGKPTARRRRGAPTRAGLAPMPRFLARRGARYRVVPRAEVVAFTFDDGVTRLHTATEQLSMQPTLAASARRLDPRHFCQVSRTVIVHLDAVREARPFPDGTGEVLLANGQTVAVARRRWKPARQARRRLIPDPRSLLPSTTIPA